MILVTIVLMIIVGGLLFALKSKNEVVKNEKRKRVHLEQDYQMKLEQKENEVGTHIQEIEKYQFSKNEMETDFKQLKKGYMQLIEQVKQHKIFSKNVGEVMASRDLFNIFETYKENGIINHYRIINNILFSDNEVRQIDHLVVCDYGIYMIETKTWKGDIFYNANKQALQGTEYGFLARYIFNDKFEKEYKTFVLKNDENNRFQVADYGNPYKQVRQSIYRIYNYFNKKYFVNGLVYFNYKTEEDQYIFFDGSEKDNSIKAVNQLENLIAYFDDKIKNSRKCMDENEINDVVSKVEGYIVL
ncbi:hypothetical protein B5P37_06360 [Staphylococcus lutrae]|uniref:NERD domain-containing protein n=2 Tax=Staphylococcus lutrae TaxID=155085 RepID=A0AAC9RRG5_9STAP|nr:hypothetical protein B5P37_06360 [Staphylococcus lutrae]